MFQKPYDEHSSIESYVAITQILWMIYKKSNIQINPVFVIQNCQKFAILLSRKALKVNIRISCHDIFDKMCEWNNSILKI
jgi:hypothetical protein